MVTFACFKKVGFVCGAASKFYPKLQRCGSATLAMIAYFYFKIITAFSYKNETRSGSGSVSYSIYKHVAKI
jgi:hypothetical protein